MPHPRIDGYDYFGSSPRCQAKVRIPGSGMTRCELCVGHPGRHIAIVNFRWGEVSIRWARGKEKAKEYQA